MLIKNADWVITLDNEGNRYPNSDILIEGAEIKSIGPNIEVKNDVEVLDAKGKVVFPGLINTHHHLYQTLTRNIPATQDLPLFPWLKTIYGIWQNLTPDAMRIATMVGIGELLKTGCTCSSDHHLIFHKNHHSEYMDIEIQVAQELGIRFHATRGSISLGENQGGLPPEAVVENEEDILCDSERVINKYHDKKRLSMCRVALAPCGLHSATQELFRKSAKLARKYGVMLHTHLAESLDEVEFCLERYGCRPVEYMADLGWLGKDVWFAHAIHLDDEEIELIGKSKTGVAHCPTSNMKLSSGVCRVKDLMPAGARIGLAVDGSASNDSSNMWNELRVAYLLQKLIHGHEGLTAEEILRMATVGGAQVLGRDDIGYLAPGMAADLIMINFEELGFAGGQHDPVAAIITSGDSQVIDTSIINGEIVVKEGRILKLDEIETVLRANKISSDMIRRSTRNKNIDYYKHPQRNKLI